MWFWEARGWRRATQRRAPGARSSASRRGSRPVRPRPRHLTIRPRDAGTRLVDGSLGGRPRRVRPGGAQGAPPLHDGVGPRPGPSEAGGGDTRRGSGARGPWVRSALSVACLPPAPEPLASLVAVLSCSRGGRRPTSRLQPMLTRGATRRRARRGRRSTRRHSRRDWLRATCT